MATPPGFCDISLQLMLTGMNRPAYITFAVDSTDTDPQLVGTQILAAASAAGSLCSILDNSVSITQVRVSMGSDGVDDLVGLISTTTTGTATKTSLPPNCALLVHKLTARGGRRGRGRMFIPWVVDESAVDEAGIIAGASLTALQTPISAFRTNLVTSGNPMVLLHDTSKQGTVHPTTPGPPNAVTSLQCDKLISTQRRRLGR